MVERQSNFSRPRTRRCKHLLSTCQDCGDNLSDLNWTPSCQKYKRYICSKCWVARQKKYSKNDPNNVEKRKARTTKWRNNWTKERRTLEQEKKYDYFLKRKYNINLMEYYCMLASQKGCCAICKTQTPNGRGRFHVDHCHKTGKVRGILCSNCNLSLGKMEDNIERIENAIKYLKNNK